MRVFEGHTDWIRGALELTDGRLLSWAGDHTLRLWDQQSGTLLATLAGHTSGVIGALELADGHLLSWTGDELRLWDRQTGALLITLAGHTSGVRGVLELADGRLLSWGGDYTLCLWDCQSGALLEAASGKVVHRLHWSRFMAWAESQAPSLILGGFLGWHEGRVAGILLRLLEAGYAALWHTEASTTARYLLPDGTLVVTLDSGEVCFLKLCYGNQRLDLAALKQLILPADV